jgi:hypothetical protein
MEPPGLPQQNKVECTVETLTDRLKIVLAQSAAPPCLRPFASKGISDSMSVMMKVMRRVPGSAGEDNELREETLYFFFVRYNGKSPRDDVLNPVVLTVNDRKGVVDNRRKMDPGG